LAASLSDMNRIVAEDIDCITSTDQPWSDLINKTVLITGAGGFLASYLVKSLLCASSRYNLRLRVIGVVRNNTGVADRLSGWTESEGLHIVAHDISKPLPKAFPQADFIIHAASQASPRYYAKDPVGTLLPNTIGTANLLDHAVCQRSERFLFFSSGSVYGENSIDRIDIAEEDYGYLDPLQVRSCYGESKRMGETMCASWAHQHGLHTIVVRPFHTYGPGILLTDGRVFADFVSDVLAGRDITVRSDGTARRAFCYIADATIAFLTVLLRGQKGNAYNVANPAAETSMRELAETLSVLIPEKRVGVRFEQRTSTDQYLASSALRSHPSIEKIMALGWKPTIGIAEGFTRMIRSYL